MTLPHVLRLAWAVLGFALPLAASGVTTITYQAQPGPGQGRHLVFLSGDEEYRSEEALPMLAKILSQRHGFTCTVLFAIDEDGTINPDLNQSVPGIEALDKADGIVMALRFRQWSDAAMKHFDDAVGRGIPIVGLRTSTHAFRFPANSLSAYKHFNNFGREVLGENWVAHWGANRRGATLGVVEPGAEDHPILRGVEQVFGDSGVYEVHPVEGSTILMRGQVLSGMSPTDSPASCMRRRRSDGQEQDINTPMMALAWTRLNLNPNGKVNRVFTTTMGAATDLTSEGSRRLVVNGVLWAFDIDIPQRTDVRYVDPFEPTDYAFNGFRLGIKPADHAIGKNPPRGPAALARRPAATLESPAKAYCRCGSTPWKRRLTGRGIGTCHM